MPLQNYQYDTIMREYNRRQARNRRIQEEHLAEAYEKIPRLREIDEEVATLSARKARALISRQEVGIEDLRNDIALLSQERTALLLSSGYPADYLELTYSCPDCHDTGFIGDKKCHCFKQAMVDLLYRQSNIHDVLKRENFDTFDIRYYSDTKNRSLGVSPRENIQAVLSTCHDFIDHFDEQSRNLLFYGDTGVGKTFLTNCIARELLDASHTVIYLTAFHLVDILQNNTFGNDDMDDTDENMFHYILDCDLLIIDDLGTELNNAFITSQLFLCINERLLARKSTIISTNLSLDELQNEYSERIFSRLVSNYEIMLILGDDIRIKKAISE